MDLRKNKKVIATITIEDQGQDFTELDLLEDGIILGNSIMFKNGRISMIGIGDLHGMHYYVLERILEKPTNKSFKGLYIYIKKTEDKTPLPWNADTLKYQITGTKKPIKPNRFLNK